MANEYAVNKEDLKSVADKLRKKANTTGMKLKFPEEFNYEIDKVYNKGHSDGHSEGYERGYENGEIIGNQNGYLEGWQEGYERHSKYGFPDKFWEIFQEGGNRRDYKSAFQYWSGVDYNPKYKVIISGDATDCFRAFNNSGYNHKEYDADFTLKNVDFSEATWIGRAFFEAVIRRIDFVDFSNVNGADNAFFRTEVVDILRLKWPTRSTASINNMFNYASLFEIITIEGTIKQNNLNLQWSTKLTHDSLMSFIKALEDKSNDTSGTVWKLTIGSTNLAKLTDNDLQIAWDKGWEVV